MKPLELIKQYGGILLLITVVVAFCAILYWLSVNVDNTIQSIENPTERGLMYVAVSILVHCFLSNGKSDK